MRLNGITSGCTSSLHCPVYKVQSSKSLKKSKRIMFVVSVISWSGTLLCTPTLALMNGSTIDNSFFIHALTKLNFFQLQMTHNTVESISMTSRKLSSCYTDSKFSLVLQTRTNYWHVLWHKVLKSALIREKKWFGALLTDSKSVHFMGWMINYVITRSACRCFKRNQWYHEINNHVAHCRAPIYLIHQGDTPRSRIRWQSKRPS